MLKDESSQALDDLLSDVQFLRHFRKTDKRMIDEYGHLQNVWDHHKMEAHIAVNVIWYINVLPVLIKSFLSGEVGLLSFAVKQEFA